MLHITYIHTQRARGPITSFTARTKTDTFAHIRCTGAVMRDAVEAITRWRVNSGRCTMPAGRVGFIYLDKGGTRISQRPSTYKGRRNSCGELYIQTRSYAYNLLYIATSDINRRWKIALTKDPGARYLRLRRGKKKFTETKKHARDNGRQGLICLISQQN